MLGCGFVSYFREGARVVPLSPMGMLVGVTGTLLVLGSYKMLGGYYFYEGEYVPRSGRRRRGYRRRRRYDSAAYED